jgi:CopG family nickel-responsive transcriptional regulator
MAAKADSSHDEERHGVTRFSASVDPALLREFDEMTGKLGYNRSTALVAAMRNFMVDRVWEGDGGEVVGTITLLYDHHRGDVTEALTEIQHDYTGEVAATTHIHLDHNNCLEITMVHGETKRIKALTEKLSSCRGVKQSKIAILKK